jgi:hypothetical protein
MRADLGVIPDDSLAGCGGAGGIWQGVKPRIATARGPIPNRHHLHQRGRLRLDRCYNAQGLGGWGSPGHIVDPCSALDFAGCCGANFRIEHQSPISPCASFAPASAKPAAVRAGWAPVRGGVPHSKKKGWSGLFSALRVEKLDGADHRPQLSQLSSRPAQSRPRRHWRRWGFPSSNPPYGTGNPL